MRLLHIGWLAIPLWSSMQDNRFNMLNKEQQLILYFIINQSATYKNDVQGAAVVLLEHRFYGHSRPTNNTRLKSLQFRPVPTTYDAVSDVVESGGQ